MNGLLIVLGISLAGFWLLRCWWRVCLEDLCDDIEEQKKQEFLRRAGK